MTEDILKELEKETYNFSEADLFKPVSILEKEGKPKEYIKAYSQEVARRITNKELLIKSKIEPEIMLKFEDKVLLDYIHEEISKTHLGDDNLKMTVFLCCVSALLTNQKRRMSLALKGNSSVGKNNLIESALRHMPIESFIYLTSGTQATIEDDISDKRIIAFNEVNKNREAGANKFLIEIIKQKSEGGTSALKKDIRTGMKTARHEETEQATIIYPTTETEGDEELGTRMIEGTITTSYQKVKSVNDKTLDSISDMNSILEANTKEDSWIRKVLTYFYRTDKGLEVVLPFAKYLKDQINGQDIFDHNSPRSQRDVKRLLALTCAMAYLFQMQRKKVEYKGKTFLIGEVQDFIRTLNYSFEYFNQSYSGLDERLTNVIKVMNELGGEWISRDLLQEKLDVSRNTMKKYCERLAGEGLIEGNSGKELNESEGIRIYDGNKIYYKRCQKGSKKPLIRCQVNELKTYLEEKIRNELTPLETPHNSEDKNINKRCQNEGVKIDKSVLDSPIIEEIDTFSLTPLENHEEEFDKNKIEVVKA